MRRFISLLTVILIAVSVTAMPALARVPISLKGSPASMQRQHGVAQNEGLTFAEYSDQVFDLAERGDVVALIGNANLTVLPSVSFPYARPEVRLFVERLAEQYRKATGEKLVVTSLMRPTENQPWNAHALSVHPAGIAVDFRVSSKASSRKWLESVLLKLETEGVLDVTRERRPPHYHVALFPDEYRGHVEGLIGPQAVATALLWMKPAKDEEAVAVSVIPVASPAVSAAPARADENHALAVIPLAVLVLGMLYIRRTNRQGREATV